MFKIGDFSKLAQVSVKTLRYYDKLRLLPPAWIDRYTGYRFYSAEQLPRLNRILALKDLGFSLDQIQRLISEGLPAAELRGMMRMKQADLEHHIRAEQERIERVEERLRQIEQEGMLSSYDVVLKSMPPQSVAGLRQVAASRRLIPALIDKLRASLKLQGTALENTPSLAIYYDAEYHEQGLDVEVALPSARPLPTAELVMVHELPGVESMACATHLGAHELLPEAYSAMLTWIETHGYRVSGPNRDVYLQSQALSSAPAGQVTEIQFPVQKKPTPFVVLKHQEKSQMEPQIVSKPAMTVVGMLYHGKNEHDEIGQMWGQFNPRMKEIKNIVDGCFGVCGASEADGAFKYLAGFAVSSVENIPQGMTSWDVPAQTYAVFPCTLKTIGETYRYAFDVWLPQSGRTYTKGPDFEYYDENFDPNDPEKGVLYIYVPVQ